jgi:hypothetical protein
MEEPMIGIGPDQDVLDATSKLAQICRRQLNSSSEVEDMKIVAEILRDCAKVQKMVAETHKINDKL